MTKVHWMFIGGLAIFILLLFGHGSYEKYQKRKQARVAQTLVSKIMKHNDPSYGKKPKHPVDRHDNMEDGVDTSADKEDTEVVDIPSPSARTSRRLQGGQVRGGATVVGVDGAYGNSYNNTANRPAPQQPVAADGNYYPPTGNGGQGGNYQAGNGAQGNYQAGTTAGAQGYPVHQNYGNTNYGNPNAAPPQQPSSNEYYPPTQ